VGFAPRLASHRSSCRRRGAGEGFRRQRVEQAMPAGDRARALRGWLPTAVAAAHTEKGQPANRRRATVRWAVRHVSRVTSHRIGEGSAQGRTRRSSHATSGGRRPNGDRLMTVHRIPSSTRDGREDSRRWMAFMRRVQPDEGAQPKQALAVPLFDPCSCRRGWRRRRTERRSASRRARACRAASISCARVAPMR